MSKDQLVKFDKTRSSSDFPNDLLIPKGEQLADRISSSAINFYHSPFVVVQKGQNLVPDGVSDAAFLDTIGQPCHVKFNVNGNEIVTNPPTVFVGRYEDDLNVKKLRYVIIAGVDAFAPPCIIFTPGGPSGGFM